MLDHRSLPTYPLHQSSGPWCTHTRSLSTPQVIRSAYPDHAVLGEEGGVSGNQQSEYLWVVDPIDGTTNFAHSYPSFAGISLYYYYYCEAMHWHDQLCAQLPILRILFYY